MLPSKRVLAFTVAFSLHALFTLQTPAATPAEGTTILFFRSPEAATIDAHALLDAVAVYTRDLGLTVRAAADSAVVPSDARAAAAVAATLRAHDARLGFWCEMRPGAEVAALTVVARDGQLEVHLVERTGAHEAELHRAIALKLRSVLTGTATPEPAVRVPAPPPAPPPPVPPPGPAPASPATIIRAAPPAPPPPSRLFVTVGYRFSTPIDAASPRHALAIDGGLALGRLLEIDAGTELAARREQRITGAAGTDTLSIFDCPITAGARVVGRGPRFSFGGGLFFALHLLWASATGYEGAQQSAFTAMGGAGADLIARAGLARGLAAELRLFAEIPVPTTSYSVRGSPPVDVGTRAGLGLGLAFPAP